MSRITEVSTMRIVSTIAISVLFILLSVSLVRADDVTPAPDTTVSDTSTIVDTSATTDSTGSPQTDSTLSTDSLAGQTSTVDTTVTDITDTSATPPDTTSTTDTSSTPDTSTTDTTTTDPSSTPDTSTTDTTTTDTSSSQTASAAVSLPTPVLSTDKADYHPDETATIFGNFFGALQNIILTIFGGTAEEENYTESTQAVTTDESGSFVTTYLLDHVYRPIYTIVANAVSDVGTAGAELARATFTDSPIDVTPLELDGNALNNSGGGTDWNDIIGATCDTVETGGGVIKATCVTDQLTGDQGFNTGGSKDNNDISSWQWSAATNEVTPAKDNIRHAFGALMTDGTGHQIIYFGLDRETNNGDAQVGFWLLKDKVSPGVGGAFVDANNNPAVHTNGDLLIQANFTNGGSISNLSIYKWQSGALVLVESTTPGASTGCNTTASGFPAGSVCVGVNSANANLSWVGTVGASIFFEGGIDLTDLGFASNSCVSEFLAETRSSQSFSAQLKDFAFGDLSTCGSLTIVKDAVPDSAQDFSFTTTGTGLSSFSLDDDADATLSNTKTFSSLVPGTYSVTEGSVANWNSDGGVCSDGSLTSAINIGASENVTCTFTNTLQQAHLTLLKTVVNDNGGTAVDTAWTLTASGPTPISGVEGSSAVTNAAVNAGSYTLGETGGPSNYTASQYSCVVNSNSPVVSNSLTLAPGDNATCTITNDDNAAHLIVIKHVINDNGGSAVASAFSTTISGVTTATPTAAGAESPGVDNVLTTVGSYSIDEGAHVGYDKTLSTDCTGTIALGQTKTCTITNNDQAAHLIVIKHVVNDNGGTATAGNWTMTIGGVTASGGNSFAGAESPGTNKTLSTVGSYTVTEGSGPSGYTQTSASADCSGTIALGETKTCTITNDDVQPKLTLTKVVVNDNGGTKIVSDFPLFVDSTGVTSGVQNGFNAGAHTASETNQTGYAAGSWTGDCAADGSITLAPGDVKSCTITNDDIAPKLHLRKIVTNDNGGTATVADFTLTANGAGANDLSGTSPVDSGAGLLADTWTLSESGASGYSASAWACTGGTQGDATHISVGIGGEATCTITNDDIAPILTVIKHVVNDNGGDNVAADFTMNITGTNVAGASSAGAESPGTDHTLNAGAYSVDESAFAGYTKAIGAGCSGTIAVGEHKTCTITNDDIAPTITLTKVVNNNHGGNAGVNDFGLTVGGSSVTSGEVKTVTANTPIALNEAGLTGYQFVSLTGDAGCPSALAGTATLTEGQNLNCTITNEDLPAHVVLIKNVINDNGGTAVPNDFDLSVGGGVVLSGSTTTVNSNTPIALNEDGFTGYSFVSITGAGCPTSLGGTVTLDEGQTITCTITNDDIPAHLIVIKHVDNGTTGATATAGSFSTSITGVTTATPTAAGAESPGVNNTLTTVGSYSVDEGAHVGYTKSLSADCTGTIALGETKTCTITNTAIAPTLTLIKHVVNDNGGTKVVADFPLKVDSTTVTSGATTTETVGAHTASETSDPTYAASSWSGDCAADGSVTLALGDAKTCEITNDDIAPKLHLRKVVVNDNGGSALASAWTLTADGAGTNDVTGSTPVDSGATLQADTFALSESGGPSGYDASAWSCVGGSQNGSNITVGIGGEATCTITNDDQVAHLIVIKHVINDDGDIASSSDFTMHLTGTDLSNNNFPGSESGVTVDLDAGAYTANETNSNGYVKTLSADCSGTVANGETKTCTITNNDIPHATRTLGFWQTHTVYTTTTFGTSSWVIGTYTVDTTAELFAGFYASISKKTDGSKRSQLDQARMQLLQQWLAAKLNCAAFTCGIGTQTLLTNAAAAFGGTDRNFILSYASQLDAYNNSNDALPISGQGSATPSASKTQASGSLSFWNVLP